MRTISVGLLDQPAQLIRRDETTAEAKDHLICGEILCREEPRPLDDGRSDNEVRMDPEGLGRGLSHLDIVAPQRWTAAGGRWQVAGGRSARCWTSRPSRRQNRVIAYKRRMAVVIVQGVFSVDPDERDRFVETSVEAMRSSREEEGCLEYVIAADPLDPERAVLSERWESMEHLEQHLARQRNAAPGCGRQAGASERRDHPLRGGNVTSSA